MSLSTFQTVLRNTSGHELNIGFVQRGARLADNEEITINGDPLTRLTRKRYRDAYLSLLTSGDLTVMSSPIDIHYDPTLAMPKVLAINNGAVSVANPSVGAYSSSMS